ncbi:EF-P 5-aminopentanol modification-associated protein YfmH [Chengkuizengella sediminis]|uniref:EF-P 5-aminopentanol modification-associated protein YfmH n=1 Tax=Chengkuizengella sediminis TaxID=1885917 RepID=UPI00138A4A30|nr:pitrilysin family protein [Chengkuizengella sediminis]NDI33326.1 insulinase family protein [Chengkuizengella sediminis]
MKTIPYEKLNEEIFFEQLDNGLQVFILPKPGFKKTFATFSTNYGSVDNHFQVEGKDKVKVPDGIAHFLEHKMFEEPTGDVFSQFSSQGASANAFTSFDRTVYLFSATEQIEKNIETLINFVQNPYFTDESVEKEKGIIGQEINMYKDNPDWRCYFGLIDAMYHTHPVHIDIAGTIDSISKITKEQLFECYYTFYHPSNMNLFIVGGVEPEKIMKLVKENQAHKNYKKQGDIKRYFENESTSVKEVKKITVLPVSLPKCLFGFKESELENEPNGLLQRECEMKVLLDILFGSSSEIYQKLYDEKLITDQFSHEYNGQYDYAFSIMGGETKNPEMLLSRVREEIEKVMNQGIKPTAFERSRKKKIGTFLRLLNSPESIASEFTRYQFKNIDLFDILTTYENMKIEQINNRLNTHFDWTKMSASIVQSEENG